MEQSHLRVWQTSRREIKLDRPLVMGILNATPDSFSDGGNAYSIDDALRRAEQIVAEGGDIIDIGGESTRPGSKQVSVDEEKRRVVPVIEAVVRRFDIAVSIDTTKSEVASAAVDAGAEIINDISGLRFDLAIADVAAASGAALVLMHSRGDFEKMHRQPPVDDIFAEVERGLSESVRAAESRGVRARQIAVDVGIGFGKSVEQNLQLVGGLNILVEKFAAFPMLVGTSRKSFIGKVTDGASVDERLAGSVATAAIAVWNGARIIRAHDVAATVQATSLISPIKRLSQARAKSSSGDAVGLDSRS